MKQFKKKAIKKTFLPIPILFSLFSIKSWQDYSSCKQMYFYFKSAHILSNKENFTENQIRKAKKRLSKLLFQLQTKTEKEKNSIRSVSIEERRLQESLDKRILDFKLKNLIKILDEADQAIPKVLMVSANNQAKIDVKLFQYSLRTISSLPEFAPKSIFEASIIRETEEMKEGEEN